LHQLRNIYSICMSWYNVATFKWKVQSEIWYFVVKFRHQLITSKDYEGHHDLVNHYGNICLTNDHGGVPFVEITIPFFTHLWLITRVASRVTRWFIHLYQSKTSGTCWYICIRLRLPVFVFHDFINYFFLQLQSYKSNSGSNFFVH
jgi:hypothetical protein